MSESFKIAGGGVVRPGDVVWHVGFQKLPKPVTVKGRGRCMTIWVGCVPGGDYDPEKLYSTEAEALDEMMGRAFSELVRASRDIERAERCLRALTARRVAIAAADPLAPASAAPAAGGGTHA